MLFYTLLIKRKVKMARVRYIVDDVEVAVDFYVSNLGFSVKKNLVLQLQSWFVMI